MNQNSQASSRPARLHNHNQYQDLDIHQNPLSQVSATAYVLGVVSGISLTAIICLDFIPRNLSIYIAFLSFFHFQEYFITSKYQPQRVSIDSFVINNGRAYQFAHSLALLEFLIELYFFPNFKKFSHPYIKLFGFILTLFGQFIRSLSMITAGENFSHVIQNQKHNNHKLVTHGIYSYIRHPSYFGFFYWALGTQLLLSNPLSFVAFAFMLFNFFSNRISYEEETLVNFFGNDYLVYKNNVPVGIPFIH